VATKKRSAETERRDITRIGLFLLFDALVMHDVLASQIPNVKSLHEAPGTNIIPFLKEEWSKILDIDYEPVFRLSFNVLNSFPTSPTTDSVFRILIDAAQSVVSSNVLMKHDLLGRIYHKLLLGTTGKYYATYYTSIPAAWLLGYLCVHTENPDMDWDFSSTESISKLKIIDPACGSGTLLSAVYLAIKDAYVISSGGDVDLESLHKVLLEECLNGWDVLEFAGHLALTTLALHNNQAGFTSSSVYKVPIGVAKDGTVHLGSLDYLTDQPVLGLGFGAPTMKKGIESDREVAIQVEPFDMVIMNPPYSRSANPNVKFGFATDAIRKILDKELSDLIKRRSLTGIGVAGMSAPFVFLGDELLKNGGRLGMVLPRSCLSGVSWQKCRQLLIDNYNIEYVITNQDPGEKSAGIEAWNWSEQTTIGEVLIIAQKRMLEEDHEGEEQEAGRKPVTYVTLWNKPKNEIESIIVSHQCLEVRAEPDYEFFKGENYKQLVVTDKQVGTAFNLDQEKLGYNMLFPCLFSSPDLNKLVYELIEDKKGILTELSKISSGIGYDISPLKDYFVESSTHTVYRMIWSHFNRMSTMYLPDDTYIGYGAPKMGSDKADAVYKTASDLIISDRLRMEYHSLIAYRTHVPVLATPLWEVKADDKVKDVLTVWFNSTPGIMMFLSRAESNAGPKYQMKKGHLGKTLVPNPESIGVNKMNQLADLYQSNREKEFEIFPDEYRLAAAGNGARRILDEKITSILGLDIDLDRYYPLLARESNISMVRR